MGGLSKSLLYMFPLFPECSAWIPQRNWAEGDAPLWGGGEGEEGGGREGGGGGGGNTGLGHLSEWVCPYGATADSETSCRRHRSIGGDHYWREEKKTNLKRTEGWRHVGAGWWWLSFVEFLFSFQRLRQSSSRLRGFQSRKFFPDPFLTIFMLEKTVV